MKTLKHVPRVIVFITLASVILFCSEGYCIDSKDMQRIKTYVDKEYSKMSPWLKEAKEKPDDDWVGGDKDYLQKWVNGLEQERSRNYKTAVKWYQEALKTGRYEKPTYFVSLPLGRAFLLDNQKQNALKALRYFIKQNDLDMSGELGIEWAYTEKGESELKEEVEFAKWLITLCEKLNKDEGGSLWMEPPVKRETIKEYYENGKLRMVENYLRGDLEGIRKEYYESGNLMGEENYVNGQSEGIAKRYYESGKLLQENNYVNGKLEGICKDYYESGNLWDEENYVNGKLEGICKFYYESGKLRSEENYVNGELEGTAKEFYENGKIHSISTYSKGTLIDKKNY